MPVLAESNHNQQVAKHCQNNDDGEEDGEKNCLQRAQEFLLLLLLLFIIYYVAQKTVRGIRSDKIKHFKMQTHQHKGAWLSLYRKMVLEIAVTELGCTTGIVVKGARKKY